MGGPEEPSVSRETVPEDRKTQSHSLSRIASWGRPVSELLQLWGVILHQVARWPAAAGIERKSRHPHPARRGAHAHGSWPRAGIQRGRPYRRKTLSIPRDPSADRRRAACRTLRAAIDFSWLTCSQKMLASTLTRPPQSPSHKPSRLGAERQSAPAAAPTPPSWGHFAFGFRQCAPRPVGIAPADPFAAPRFALWAVSQWRAEGEESPAVAVVIPVNNVIGPNMA